MQTRSMRYRRARDTSTPPWVDRAAIDAVYARAKTIRVVAGINLAVDHIYPVDGDSVSGLHVPENLQILTTRENCRKGRKMPGPVGDELWSKQGSWTPMEMPEVDAVILRGMLSK